MKLNINKRNTRRFLGAIAMVAASLSFASCDEYLNVLPVKGEKNPVDFADYKPIFNYEYGNCYTDYSNALYLLNDCYVKKASLNTPGLTRALYLWDETADRVKLNYGIEMFYDHHYTGIGAYNLVIDFVPGTKNGTQAEKDQYVGYARVLRAYSYHVLVNYYADAYLKNKDARGVPVILSSEVNAPHSQWTVAKLYDFIIAELKDVLDKKVIPNEAPNVLLPTPTAIHAMLARIYLTMGKYDEALKEAETVLAAKSDLFDWNAYYTANRAVIDDKATFKNVVSPMAYKYNETILHRSAKITNYATQENSIPVERAARFDESDTKFLCRWKLRTDNADTFYWGQLNGYYNTAGLTTTEIYLIKAECLARAGKVADAMGVVNKVRKTRVLPEKYADLTATDTKDALSKIIRFKDNEMIMTMVPFMDMKRLNAEGTLVRTLEKEHDGKKLTLGPNSHLWTMVFSEGVVNNAGNGTIEQNSK